MISDRHLATAGVVAVWLALMLHAALQAARLYV
jgi:hypothetical protein